MAERTKAKIDSSGKIVVPAGYMSYVYKGVPYIKKMKRGGTKGAKRKCSTKSGTKRKTAKRSGAKLSGTRTAKQLEADRKRSAAMKGKPFGSNKKRYRVATTKKYRIAA